MNNEDFAREHGLDAKLHEIYDKYESRITRA